MPAPRKPSKRVKRGSPTRQTARRVKSHVVEDVDSQSGMSESSRTGSMSEVNAVPDSSTSQDFIKDSSSTQTPASDTSSSESFVTDISSTGSNTTDIAPTENVSSTKRPGRERGRHGMKWVGVNWKAIEKHRKANGESPHFSTLFLIFLTFDQVEPCLQAHL
jgi:hypothetical protein